MWVNQTLLTCFCSSRCCRLQNRGCPRLSVCQRVLLSDKLQDRQWKRWSTPQETCGAGVTLKWHFWSCLFLGSRASTWMWWSGCIWLWCSLLYWRRQTSGAWPKSSSWAAASFRLSSAPPQLSAPVCCTSQRWDRRRSVLRKPDSRPVKWTVLPLRPCSGAGGVLALQSAADGADAKAELLREGGAHPPDGGGWSHGGECGEFRFDWTGLITFYCRYTLTTLNSIPVISINTLFFSCSREQSSCLTLAIKHCLTWQMLTPRFSPRL